MIGRRDPLINASEEFERPGLSYEQGRYGGFDPLFAGNKEAPSRAADWNWISLHLSPLQSTLQAGAALNTSGQTFQNATILGLKLPDMTQGSVLFAGFGGQVTQDNANFFWDDANNRLGLGNNAPTVTLDVNGNIRDRNMTQGSVLFAGSTGIISQDNANFFWDDTNNRLGIGTSGPFYPLDVWSASPQIGLEDATGTTGATLWSTSSVFLVTQTDGTQFEYSSNNATAFDRYFGVYQQRNAGAFTANAQLYAHVVGASSGDPMVQLGIDGVHAFALGLDNSDSDKFKISYAASSTASLGTNDRFVIDTSGVVYIPYFTTGSVLFAGASGELKQNNASLFWDNANARLGLGTAAPLAQLHQYHATTAQENRITLDKIVTATNDIGSWSSYAQNSAAALKNYSKIRHTVKVNTATSEEGQINFDFINGASTASFAFDNRGIFLQGGSYDVYLENGRGIQFRNNGNTADIFGISYSADKLDLQVESGGAIRFYIGASPNFAMWIDSARNVGILTSTPRRALDILDASNPQARLTYSDNSVYMEAQVLSTGVCAFSNTGGASPGFTFTNYASIGTTPATSGTFRLPNTGSILWRNSGNSQNIGIGPSGNTLDAGRGSDFFGNIKWYTSSTQGVFIDGTNGRTGINTTSPRGTFDSLSTTTSQLRATYTDNSVYADFTVGSDGKLTITTAGTLGGVAFAGNYRFSHGTSALATNATEGFFHIQSCAGAPSGTPASIPTGQIPMVWDSTNLQLYVYTGGAWKKSAVFT